MPKFMDILGYKIYFWSNEGNPLEPIHVHISKSPHQNATKLWILEDGTTQLANNNDNIPGKDLSKITYAVEAFSSEIISLWTETFQQISFHQENKIRHHRKIKYDFER